MREIKFRAWDLDNLVMYYSDREETNGEWPIWWELDSTGINFHEIQYVDWTDPDPNHTRSHKPNQAVMQFTGLHDKNGREIYEGDVLGRNLQLYKDAPVLKQAAEVIFRNGQFVGNDGTGAYTGVRYYLICTNPYEVIGNIYEHGHLLCNSRDAGMAKEKENG